VRRRDFAIGLLLASAAHPVPAQAQQAAKQHRIAIVIPAGSVARIDDTGSRFWQAFWKELRGLGDVEGRNLSVERYSGEGRPEGFANLARRAANRNPDVIVASTEAIARAARAANPSLPIVWIGGDPIQAGFATSFARPGGAVTGVTVFAGLEIWGKRLQMLKEAVPSASKVLFLTTRTGVANEQIFQEAGRRLQISVIRTPLQESTLSEIQGTFAEIAQEKPDAIMVSDIGDLIPYRRLIVELAERSRLPAMYPWREYVEAGGLMAYAGDFDELGRRMADDVHQILNGAKPGEIPIYQPTKFELIINLKAARELGLTIPPTLLGTASEVIE